ncbi:MAG: type IV toxin-antitoxin system AbiEi family antitoxin domain-containing protein [Solirubrobacteraceae bacterium]
MPEPASSRAPSVRPAPASARPGRRCRGRGTPGQRSREGWRQNRTQDVLNRSHPRSRRPQTPGVAAEQDPTRPQLQPPPVSRPRGRAAAPRGGTRPASHTTPPNHARSRRLRHRIGTVGTSNHHRSGRDRSPVHDLWISAIAARQHGLITARQLVWCGLGPRGIQHRAACGRLTRVSRGIYALGPVINDVGRRCAALLRVSAVPDPASVPPGSLPASTAITRLTTFRSGIACSHWTAAHALELTPDAPERPHVVALGSVARRTRDVVVHRTRSLHASDVTWRDGLPVTGAARTIIDIAAKASTKVVRRLIREALYRRLLTPQQWLAAVRRHRGHPGLAAVLAADPQIAVRLRGDGPAGGDLAVILDGLPLPPAVPQHPVTVRIGTTYRIDHAYPDVKLAIEGDGRREHETYVAVDDDERRTLHLAAEGWTVIRASSHRLRHDRIALGDEIVAAHSARTAALARHGWGDRGM